MVPRKPGNAGGWDGASLYDKVYREDILAHAYRLSRSKGGAAGVDGVEFGAIESSGLEEWLASLREDLRKGEYKPSPVRRVQIPKPGGGERPLGIPTIRDRVVQTAAKLVLEPVFEADFEDCAYGYRPGRQARDAVQAVHRALCDGYTEVVDADLSKYFDSIPHDQLMKSVARRISDGRMLKLIKAWLKTPVEETDDQGRKRMSGGRRSRTGTPQGGVMGLALGVCYLALGRRLWPLILAHAYLDSILLGAGLPGAAARLRRRWCRSRESAATRGPQPISRR